MNNITENGINIEEAQFVDGNPPLWIQIPGFDYLTWDSPATNPITQDDIAQNSNPIVPVDDDRVLFQGLPAMITHKAFASVYYQWDTCHCWQPYIGAGAEIEFQQRNGCSRLCNPGEKCLSCEPRWWSIWIQGGMNF